MKEISKKSWILLLAGSLVVFLLGCAAGRGYRTSVASGKNPVDALSDAAASIGDVLPISYQRTDMLVGLVAVFALLLAVLYHWTNQHKYRTGEEHGSAHWAKPSDMAPFTDADPAKNLQFTQTEGISLDTRASRRNTNVCVVGGSGSGKTRSYVLPNLRNANMSYAITDPKGEIYQEAAQELKDRHYAVHALNLVDLAASDKFNPMAYIDPASPEPAILRMVENIITNTDGENKPDAFWDKAERALLNALCAWVYFMYDDPDLTRVVDMVGDMEASEADEDHMSIIDATMASAKELYEEYERDKHADCFDDMDPDELERVMRGLRFCVSQYRTYEQGAGETKKSIIISLGVRLAPLQVSEIRELLSSDTMRLDQMGERKSAVFMILPDTNRTFNFLAAVFYQCLFESLVYKADHSPQGRLAVPVHCFLDEFANIGRIPNFETLIATIRSRAISVSVIIQAKSQLEPCTGRSHGRPSWATATTSCSWAPARATRALRNGSAASWAARPSRCAT